MIQIRWAESDLSVLETHPLTPGLVLAGATGDVSGTSIETGADATRTGSSSTITVTSSSSPSSEGGLSTGAQVGIGVGVGLFGLLAIGFAVFFILRYRKKRSQSPPPQPPTGQYPVHQYPFMPGPGQPGQPAQGYPQPAYSGYTQYVDPKTGAVSYYSPVPHPTELGGTAIEGSNLSQSQGEPSVVGSQPTQPRDSTFSSSQPMPPTVSPAGEITGTEVNSRSMAPAEMPGGEGAPRSVGGTDNLQTQQELAHLMAEQAKLDARRTRLMELAELDEEEQRIRTRIQQIQQPQ